MSDILAAQIASMDRLLAEFHSPPPVPAKDTPYQSSEEFKPTAGTLPAANVKKVQWTDPDRSKVYLGRNTTRDQGHNVLPLQTQSVMRRSSLDNMPQSHDHISTAPSRRFGADYTAGTTKTQVITMKPKKLAFAQDDSGILTPPPVSLDKSSFEAQLGKFELSKEQSTFDPPMPPRVSRFPEQIRDMPKKKPMPLNLNRPTSQTGKWNVHKETDVWTPIEDEPNTAARLSMEAISAPKICPLPYKPVKSVPLRTRGSLRPAPLRIRKAVKIGGVKSPIYLPLKSPAPFKKAVRFQTAKSPAAASFKVASALKSKNRNTTAAAGRKRTVRFDAVPSPAVPRFTSLATPFNQESFGEDSDAESNQDQERRVRFYGVPSPAVPTFNAPPTPFEQESFMDDDLESEFEDEDEDEDIEEVSSRRGVRFANLKSPAVSSFKIPPTPYHQVSFERPASGRRRVRFASLKSPAVASFKGPPTPYHQSSFQHSMSRRRVRFAGLKSPAVSQFKIPPTPYNKSSFETDEEKEDEKSPTEYSPVTPRTTQPVAPLVASGSPMMPFTSPPSEPALKHELQQNTFLPLQTLHQRSSSYQQAQFPPRSSSLHQRNNSLPQPNDVLRTAELPATTFDESAVGASTLKWLGVLPKPSYRVGEGRTNDRNKILGSYFEGSRTSF